MAYADTIDPVDEFDMPDVPDDTLEAVEQPAALKLQQILASDNLVSELDEQTLTDISHKAIEGYRLDDASREPWKVRNEEGMKLATLVSEQKDYPFIKASNVKAPLIIAAAIQFNAMAYPELVKTERVTKCKVNGQDPNGDKARRAERVSQHSSWQMLTEMPEWEQDTDRLTLIVAITGVLFRKRYWDPTLGRQCSRLVTADRFVYNYHARSVEDCPRISEKLYLYPYEIQERIRDGRFIEFEYGQATSDEDGEDRIDPNDDQAPHLFIEQHRLWDLDEDGYPEPYIVTIHLETEKVCRIVPNFTEDTVRVTEDGTVAAIRRRDYYTKYTFIESPDGGSYGLGFGELMGSTTATVNTLINEMLDAGHLANTQGGFISSSAGIREKNFSFRMGEFKVVNSNMPINQAIMPLPFPGPSPVLFQLLNVMIEFARDISSTKDVMTGDTGGKAMQPTTVLALIQQGMKVFSAIFKRLHRALGNEIRQHATLNYEHLSIEDYNRYWDNPEQQFDPKVDYDLKSMDISPLSDPTVSTQMQKLAKAQVAAEIGFNKPYINQMELDRRRFEAAEIEDIDKLFVPPPQPDPAQQAFMEAMQKMTLLDLKTKIERIESQTLKDTTGALKDIADAEAAEIGQQLSFYDQYLRMLQAEHGMEMDQNAQVQGGPGGVPGMEGPPSDPMGAVPTGGAEQGGGIPAQPGAMGPSDALAGADAGAAPAASPQAGAM